MFDTAVELNSIKVDSNDNLVRLMPEKSSTLAHFYLIRDSPIRPTAPQSRQLELVSGLS